MRHFLFIACGLILLLSLNNETNSQTPGLDVSRLDRTVAPCKNFYQFTNGGWLEKTRIPEGRSRWSSGDVVSKRTAGILESILEEAIKARGTDQSSSKELVGAFFGSCVNEQAIESAGARPIAKELKNIRGLRSKQDIAATVARMHSKGVQPLFRFYIQGDENNADMVIANTFHGGLSMPNRDYYIDGSSRLATVRDAFRKYVVELLIAYGDDETTARTKMFSIVRMQNRLARVALTTAQQRNPKNYFDVMTIDEANKITPSFDWNMYMNARDLGHLKTFNLGLPKYFTEVEKMINEHSIEEWRTYFEWMTKNHAAPHLSKRYSEPSFGFYFTTLRGVAKPPSRRERCIRSTDQFLTEALGELYVEKAFDKGSKTQVNKLIDNLIAAMRNRLQENDWMSPSTKGEALEKLNRLKRKIGYPEVIRGYQGLKLKEKVFFEDRQTVSSYLLKRRLRDIGKPQDRTRFSISPAAVNAYAESQLNEIVFPAGILQPPYFDPNADDALNYGAIGAVIGHEIVHGFDEFGSRFDSKGNVRQWWTKEDKKEFNKRTVCLVEQFNKYEVAPGLFINGRLSLGENIADLGGLRIAYDAFQKSRDGKEETKIDGFTPNQRFFIGWARVMASKSTEQYKLQSVTNNFHPISRYRVNGPLKNMPEFAEAFGCGVAGSMTRKDACRIW